MPVMKCTVNGRPGWKWGQSGKCYTYTPHNKKSREQAKAKAAKQGRAIHASGYKG